MKNSVVTNEFAQPAEAERSDAAIDVLEVLRRRWPIVVSVATICCGLAVAYWYVTPPTYESEAQILIMKKDPGLASTGTQNNRESSQMSEDILSTHMQIFQGKRNVAMALRDNDLENLPSIQENLGDDETPVDYVIDHLDVTRGGTGQAKTAHVLNVAYRNESAADSQRVVEALVARYQTFVKEKFEDVNQEAAELIARVRMELEDELVRSEDALVEMRKNAPLLWNGDESTNIHRLRFEQIQQELSTLRLEAAGEKARLQIVQQAQDGDNTARTSILQELALIDDRSLTRLGVFAEVFKSHAESEAPFVVQTAQTETQSLLALIAKEQTLRQDFGPNHPEVAATRKQIEIVRGFLREKSGLFDVFNNEKLMSPGGLLDAYSRILRHDLETINQRKVELESLATEEEQAAKKLVAYELEDQTLRKQVERKQQLYDAAVDRLREINLAKDYGGFVNEVIAVPSLGEKVWPKLSLCLVLGAFAGLVLGTGGAFAAEYLDGSFRNADEVERVMDLPVLAQVPTLKPRKKEEQWTLRDEYVDQTVCVFHAPLAPQSEVFRGVRTQLFFTSQDQPLRSLSVTSPNPGDGKSTLVVNLAFSMAQAGRRVLLVDCDMRRPRLHKLLGFENTAGLADAMGGKFAAWDIVQSIDETGVSFLPAGRIPGNPAELLESDGFKAFVEEAQQRYDFVFLDCPPVLKVSDPCIVGSRVDGVLLALRITQDTKAEATHARELLDQSGASVLGLMLNCWDIGSSFSSYGGYNYGYGYGYGDAYSSDPDTNDDEVLDTDDDQVRPAA